VTKPDSGESPTSDHALATRRPPTPDAPVPPDRPVMTCDDTDGDGISDRDEGAPRSTPTAT
jgi:hypothetical protein